MKLKRILPIITFLFFLTNTVTFSQLKNTILNGYVSAMNSVMFTKTNDPWIKEDLIHNRLNFTWYMGTNFTFEAQARNRLIWGDRQFLMPDYNEFVTNDNGFFNMSFNLTNDTTYILNTYIDRLNLQFANETWSISLGRQRINWGRTLVWNTNDIFNSYSFFDFDYPERPGADALRIQFYPSFTSSVELAAKVDNKNKITAGLKYKFNFKSYDIQLLSGVYNETDWVFGTGWEGALWNLGFKGEATYLQPIDDGNETFLMSMSLDYTFSNSLYIISEVLFADGTTTTSQNSPMDFYGAPQDIRSMAFADFMGLVQASYPVTPLLNVSGAIMVFPELNGYYIGPSMEYSLRDDLYLSLYYQYFKSEFTVENNASDQKLNLAFLRLKWNF